MPDYDFFISQEGLRQMHETAVRILDEIGIRTDHAGMRERLAGQGCRVNGDTVTIPPDLIARTLANTPSGFQIYGRTSEQSLRVDLSGHTYYINTGILPNILDFETGEVRRTTLRDVELTTRVLDALPEVDAVYVSLVDATDLPPHMITVCDFAATMANTTKPLLGPGVTNRVEAEAIVALARALRGGADELARYPVCTPFICPITPLHFPSDLVEATIVIAEAGLPLDVVTNPVMGLTAPYTVAGSVALGHAEVLASTVIAHAVRPGLPILNQNTPSVADMRTLASTTGGPETGLIRRAVVELSHYVKLPVAVHGHTSSAYLDTQMASEKALNNLLLASARPSLLGGLGALSNVTLASYEGILLDAERYGAIRRILEGVAVDEDHLAFDVVAQAVAGTDILSQDHTLSYLRSNEVWKPKLALRQGLVNGAPPAQTEVERARAAVEKIVQTHQVEPLPENVQIEIRSILDAYEAHS